MKKVNIRFLSSIFVLCAFGVTGANAAPSVKILGTNNARIGSNATVVKSADVKSDTSNQQRLGSIRAKTVTAGVPVTVKKTTNTISSGNTDDTSRLSLGKYIHSTGIASGSLKPTGTTATVSSDEFFSLRDQVEDLQDTKQDVLTPGFGLKISDNVISVNEEILDISDQIDSIYDEIDTKVSESDLADNYYSVEEVDALLEEHGITSAGKIYDTATHTYQSVEVVDEFNEEILTKND